MATRKSISTRERIRLFQLHLGICHICGEKIDGTRERWDIEHALALALGGEDDDQNRKLAHHACHKPKTKDDIQRKAKADRQRAKFIGAKSPSKNPVPGSKNTPFKKKFNGTTVRREA